MDTNALSYCKSGIYQSIIKSLWQSLSFIAWSLNPSPIFPLMIWNKTWLNIFSVHSPFHLDGMILIMIFDEKTNSYLKIVTSIQLFLNYVCIQRKESILIYWNRSLHTGWACSRFWWKGGRFWWKRWRFRWQGWRFWWKGWRFWWRYWRKCWDTRCWSRCRWSFI